MQRKHVLDRTAVTVSWIETDVPIDPETGSSSRRGNSAGMYNGVECVGGLLLTWMLCANCLAADALTVAVVTKVSGGAPEGY